MVTTSVSLSHGLMQCCSSGTFRRREDYISYRFLKHFDHHFAINLGGFPPAQIHDSATPIILERSSSSILGKSTFSALELHFTVPPAAPRSRSQALDRSEIFPPCWPLASVRRGPTATTRASRTRSLRRCAEVCCYPCHRVPPPILSWAVFRFLLSTRSAEIQTENRRVAGEVTPPRVLL